MSYCTMWKSHEDALLIRLYNEGVTYEDMCSHGLKRSRKAIGARVLRLQAQGDIVRRAPLRVQSALKSEPHISAYDHVEQIREATRRLGEAYHAAWQRRNAAA